MYIHVHTCIFNYCYIGQDETFLYTLSVHIVFNLSSSYLVHLLNTEGLQVVHKLINCSFLKIDHSMYTRKWTSMRHSSAHNVSSCDTYRIQLQ